MFNSSWTELLVIAVVALVVLGPKDLPRAMRAVGQWTGRVKRMSGDFQRQLHEAVRQAELEDVKNEVKGLGKLNPLADLKTSLTKVDADLKGELGKVDKSLGQNLVTPESIPPTPTASSIEAADLTRTSSP